MDRILNQRLAALRQHSNLLQDCRRGIEKESLRVKQDGWLARTPHPKALGSALTHPHITTDYSESLLELITDAHTDVHGVMAQLDEVHRLVAQELKQEYLWNHSMPGLLPSDADIPIAWYGTSNTGMLKHVYRRGLAVRYGKRMQCIAGLHYNFSLPQRLWDLEDIFGEQTPGASQGYVNLIRNFMRHSWLLMYLFGASPVVAENFLVPGATHRLQNVGPQTYGLPYATSLRMSDLGYQNKAQSTLKLCYNDLPTFLMRLYDAVTTSWPDYERIGTHQNGEWVQLNCNLLQIENEFYSSIRPKQTTARGERPITALAQRGVQYIEIRCLDIDPFAPCGLTSETARFMDAFLLFCALEHSPAFGDDGYCQESATNFSTVVTKGREPDLALWQSGVPTAMTDWAMRCLDSIEACAEILGEQLHDPGYGLAVHAQRLKVQDSGLTPSSRVFEAVQQDSQSFIEFAMALNLEHHQSLLQRPLTSLQCDQAVQLRDLSLQQQVQLEADHTVSFETYVKQFNDALSRP